MQLFTFYGAEPPKRKSVGTQRRRRDSVYEMSAPARMDDLLAQRAWIRRVAASLVHEDAEDIAQETWVAAIESPPESSSNVAAWLGTVARNFVRKRARAETRRGRRHMDAPDHRQEPLSPESLVERAELQQLIAAAVLELSEPFRSTLLLHYFEELSPAEIAAREGIPAATVRSRLKRGLDDLRAQLDRAHGGKRRAWLAPVGALAAHRGSAIPLAWKGLMIMKAKLTVAAVVAIVLAALVVGRQLQQRSSQSAASTAAPPAESPSSDPANHRITRAMRAWTDPSAPARSAIEGVVRGPDGKPLDGALVGAVPEDSDADELHVHSVSVTVSAGGGRFRIVGLRPGAYAAQATARGLSPAYRSGLVVLDGETVKGIELRLEKGGVTVVGHLRDVGGGIVPGGRLHARRHGEERPEVFTAACDANGLCPLTLGKGGYTLVAEADGYAPAKKDIVAMLDQRVELQLAPAATLRGRVVDHTTHAPVPGASVALALQGSFVADSQVVADEGGVFEFRDLSPGEYQLSAAKGKLAGRAARPIAISLAGYAGDVTIEVAPARSILGRVLGPSAPAGGAKVLLRPARSMGNVIARVQAAADGRYSIDGLLPGAYQLRGESTGLAPAVRDVVVGEQDVDGADLSLSAGGEVNGIVLGKGRTPVAGALVSASVEDGEFRTSSAAARSGGDGRFHLDGLGAGLLFVSASHPDHGSTDGPPARMAIGEKKEMTLSLDASASIEGAVTWEDGAPAVGVAVRAQSSSGDAVSTTTGDGGAFRLSPLAAGIHFVIATREAGALVARDPSGRQSEVVTVASEEHKSGVKLMLLRGGHKISGQVLGPDGTPVADAMVRADAEDEAGASTASGDPRVSVQKTMTAADGAFTVEDLTAGHFVLTASHDGFPNASAVHVAADTTSARIQFKAQATIEGVAVTPDGKPVSDYGVTLFTSERT